MRLIDADALLKTLTVFDEKYTLQKSDVFHHIINAPTVQREGWVSVPIEPTEGMIDAASATWKHAPENTFGFVLWENIYKAMISAAPKE